METGILSFCFLFLAYGFVFADESQTAKILDAWASALGGREKIVNITTVYSKGTVTTGGLSGQAEDWVTSTGKHRASVDFGDVYSNLTVFDAIQRKGWILDQNGKVRDLENSEIQDEITGAYLNSFSFFFPGRLAGKVDAAGGDDRQAVLKITPEGGRVVTMYLDRATGLPVKQEQPQQDRTLTLTFSDWREVDGVKFPFQVRQSTGNPKYDALVTLTEIKINVPVDQSAFAKPEEAAPDYKFTSGNSATGIPFELNQNHIYVQVSVNGSRPLWFLLDTGAGYPVINEKRVAELALQKQGALEARGAGEGSSEVSLVANMSYKLPGVELFKQKAGAFPLESIEGYDGRQIDGIIGYDFISRFVMEIDYENNILNLYSQQDYKYTGSGEIIPISLDGNIPKIAARVEVPGGIVVEGRFDVDTGARSSLVLNKPFHEAHNLLAHVPHRLDASWGFGVGGQTKDTLGRISKFRIGRLTVNNLLTSFSFDTKGAFADLDNSGNIGGEVLRRFKVILDYPGKRMILEPNKHYNDPSDFDMSGLALTAEGPDLRTFKVLRVTAGSPAANSKIQAGDYLEKIDDQSAKEFTLEQIREMLKVEGQSHALFLRRGDTSIEATIKLRRLI